MKIEELNDILAIDESYRIERIATAYIKLLFPHWTTVEDVDLNEIDTFCLQPAIRRRGIIQQQCHYIDPEYKAEMPAIWVRR